MSLRQPLDTKSREQITEMLRQLPEREVRERVGGISPESFARAVGGLPINRGTAHLIRSELAKQPSAAA